jgi:hypothetical protein
MATTLEIVRTLSNIVGQLGYDGALDEKGDPVKIGLKREEGHPILDSRVMDGFGVLFYENKLCIKYHSEIKLSDIYKNDLEAEVDNMIHAIVKFLKSEYRKVTKSTLKLTPIGECVVTAENTSRVRYFVTANKHFTIGGAEGTDPIHGDSRDSIEASFKAFLESPDAKRPPNDTR